MNIENTLFNLVYASAQKILIANGYETDLGANLREWRGAVMPKDDEVMFEIRDVSGSAEDEQEPYQHEIINYEFVVLARKGDATAEYLRKARADIYRNINAEIESWKTGTNFSLDVTRAGFTREIKFGEKIIGELTQRIDFAYEHEFFNPEI